MDPAHYEHAATAMGHGFLSAEVHAAVKVTLPVLQKEYGFKKMYLWGKLKGMVADYIISVGVSHSLKETTKKYFYCFDGVSWAQMAQPDAATVEACAKISPVAKLTGDAQFVYSIVSVVAEGEEPPENEDDLVVKITEDVRAACLVKQIDAAVSILPVGAISVDPKLGVPIANSTFPGLSKEASLALSSWELLSEMSAQQQLAGSLKTKFIPSASLTVVRSLVWPGYSAYCLPGTSAWGSVYVGDGMKNGDVAFSLP
ncbi:hypothetical protein T492DRAFT_1085728 [Pavlovales sp. CCMP2436]|nr:hypothetical protein T492DRAFT_1085728 [Pavlovales sp. CCMP2436]|mmetsp:Transcript_43061/g.106265  ORF Transcript_43061/g.106265 Transcript_43061/m.106265 type:complete len:257 (+) Transcript_43061:22-792(+)